MNKKFECWNCGKSFDADDSHYVECPHCHSDNVEYASFHLPKWVMWGALAIVAVAGIAVAAQWLNSGPQTEEKIDIVDKTDNITEIIILQDTDSVEQVIDEPMAIRTSAPKFSEEGYSISIAATNAPNCKIVFRVMEGLGDKVVAESDKPHFDKLPASEAEGGNYRIVAVNVANDSVLASESVPGFIPQFKTQKMTAQELQTLIDNQDTSLRGAGENEHIAPVYKLVFTGLPDDMIAPKDFLEVMQQIKYEAWESVTVTGLEYNEQNQITTVKLNVTVAD